MSIHSLSEYKDLASCRTAEAGTAEPMLDIPALQRTLKLAGLLQTSLELENILQFFAESVREHLPIGGFEYRNPELDTQFRSGKTERYVCTFRAGLNGENLGKVRFSRNTRFTEAEKTQLQTCVHQLLYPLRNAILYQQALLAAQVDSLTGIHNRAAMDRYLEREWGLAQRYDHPLSLLIVDVDLFKRINDTYGHGTGDAVLQALAERMQATVRASDMLFRYGGEEFALILTGTGLDGARLMAERLRSAVNARPVVHENRSIALTVSIGAASLDYQDDTKSLFKKADAALYQAKQAGRNQVQCYQNA